MKKVELDLKSFAAGIYNTSAAMWAFGSKVDTNKAVKGEHVGKVLQLSEFMTCRESFIDVFRQQTRVIRNEVDPKRHSSFQRLVDDLKNYPITMDATRILVGFHPGSGTNNIQQQLAQRHEEMKAGLRIVNIVEKELGWARTKLYKCNLVSPTSDPKFPKMTADEKGALDRTAVYMFVGSKRFMFSPHMLSLYLLLIRLGMQSYYKDVKDMDSLMKAAHKHSGTGASDGNFVKVSYPYWVMFLREWRSLYKSRYLLTNYSYDIVPSGDASVEGIDRLCRDCCTDKALLTRFRALKSKNTKEIADVRKIATGKTATG